VEGSLFRQQAGMNVAFHYGPEIDIKTTLQEITDASKYPAIVLIQEFDEQFGTDEGYYNQVKLNFVIMQLATSTNKAEQRYQDNFKPTLYPIFDAFIFAILESGLFKECTWDQLRFTKTDVMQWGKTNIPGFDFIDAIKLSNLSLTLKKDTQ
jgi:hypothetical protein